MTMQMADYVSYNGKKYTLIDIEKGKSMIEEIPWLVSLDQRCVSTACWRGYTADYFIVDNCLYAERTEDDGWDNEVSSERQRLHYTGSCIIAYCEDDFRNSDFLMCYLGYDEALELHFTNGALDEVRNLEKAVEDYHAWWIDGTIERDNEGIITEKGQITRDCLTHRDLKYQYDVKTYRWQRR